MLAERVGFEPTVPCGITGFQDQLLKPLGHLSIVAALRVRWRAIYTIILCGTCQEILTVS